VEVRPIAGVSEKRDIMMGTRPQAAVVVEEEVPVAVTIVKETARPMPVASLQESFSVRPSSSYASGSDPALGDRAIMGIHAKESGSVRSSVVSAIPLSEKIRAFAEPTPVPPVRSQARESAIVSIPVREQAAVLFPTSPNTNQVSERRRKSMPMHDLSPIVLETKSPHQVVQNIVVETVEEEYFDSLGPSAIKKRGAVQPESYYAWEESGRSAAPKSSFETSIPSSASSGISGHGHAYELERAQYVSDHLELTPDVPESFHDPTGYKILCRKCGRKRRGRERFCPLDGCLYED